VLYRSTIRLRGIPYRDTADARASGKAELRYGCSAVSSVLYVVFVRNCRCDGGGHGDDHLSAMPSRAAHQFAVGTQAAARAQSI